MQNSHLGRLLTDQVMSDKFNSRQLLLDDEAYEAHFQDCFLQRDSFSRFVVRQPPDLHLGHLKKFALTRFYNLEHKLQRDANMKQRYVDFLSECERIRSHD